MTLVKDKKFVLRVYPENIAHFESMKRPGFSMNTYINELLTAARKKKEKGGADDA